MTPSLTASLYELPEYRRVLGNLIARDLKVKYQSKSLGFLWSLNQPTIMLAIWYVIFSRAFRVPIHDYWAYLIAGIVPFQFITSSIVAGLSSVRTNAGIIRKVYVPMEILVIAAVTVRLVEFLVQLAVAIVLLALLHRAAVTIQVPFLPRETVHFAPLAALLVIPPAVMLTYVFVLGVALPLAAWSVIYRDLEHIVGIAMAMLFYLTPVFWSLSQFQGRKWVWLMSLNPAAHLLDLFRGPLYWGTWPFSAAFGGGAATAWTVSGSIAAVTLIVGWLLFNRSKRILAEVV